MQWSLPGLSRPPAPESAAPAGGLRIAHRGGAAHGPENSLAAIREAARLGADAVELDVRLAGGALICAHDAGQEGPAVEEALRCVLDLGLRVEFDLKSRGVSDAVYRLAEVIDGLGAHGQSWVSTFQPLTAWRLRHADPRLVVGWSVARSRVERLPLWTGWASWLGVQVIEPERGLLTPERVAAWRAQGLVIETWGVDPAEERALRADGISVVVDELRADHAL